MVEEFVVKFSTLAILLGMAIQKKREPAQNILKTPQELVHIKHKITLRQYKYWLLMLRTYREAHELGTATTDQGFHRISLANMETWLGYELAKGELRSDLEAIRKEAIIYNVLGKDGQPAQRGAGFISEWELSSSWVGFKLPDFLKNSIEQMDIKGSIFNLLNWAIFNHFTGKYEAILYKLCRDYAGVGQTKWMSVEEYREYMGLKPTEYAEFKDLNKFLITLPIKRINESEVSDITVEARFEKDGRKVARVQFAVSSKRQSLLDLGDNEAFKFARVPITLSQQRQYLEDLPAEKIALSIERANSYADDKEKSGKPVSNLGALYRKAIEENWAEEYESRKKRDQERADAKRKAEEAERVAKEAEKLDEEKNRVIGEQLWSEFLERPPEDQKGFIFEHFSGNSVLLKDYTSHGLERATVRGNVISVLKKLNSV